MAARLSYKELNLLLFALTGGPAGFDALDPSCETACPVIDNVERLLGGGPVSRQEQLIRHLNNHVREGLIQCGMFEHLAAGSHASAGQADLDRINQSLSGWGCEINLEARDKAVLSESLARLPSSAWFSMPVTLWRLRRKLRDR